LRRSEAIPQAKAKEWVSLAWLEALCAQAQLNTSNFKWDDGLDLQIGSNKPLIDIGFDPGPLYICVQLKASSRWQWDDESIKLRLDVKTYNRLRNPRAVHSHYLIAVRLHNDQRNWITPRTKSMLLRHTACYLDMRGFPPVSQKKKSVEVSVPTSNHLDASTLRRLAIHEFKRFRSFSS